MAQIFDQAIAKGAVCFILLSLSTSCHISSDSSTPPSSPISSETVSTSPVVTNPIGAFKQSTLAIDIDQSRLRELLNSGGFAAQMSQWNSQIILAQLDEQETPVRLQVYAYNAIYADANQNNYQDRGDAGFFNPASTVKVGIAALALEKLNTLGLSRDAEYQFEGNSRWYGIADDLQRALVISDNEATNRLIYWLGFDPLNNRMHAKGLSSFVVNRLMLDRGTLVPSPSIALRDSQQRLKQQPLPVENTFACWEKQNTLGNCATALDLIGILARITHPQLFKPEQRFDLRDSDLDWLRQILSLTPKEAGFAQYGDDYCRFLTGVERQLARQQGQMLSKCGVALFSNSYIDTSYLKTDRGEQYFIAFAVSPPKSMAEAKILDTMVKIVLYALPRLSNPSQ